MTTDDRSLAARLRALMSARGFRTQADLARASGVTQAQVSRLLSGQRDNPSAETLRRLEAALGAPVYGRGGIDRSQAEAAIEKLLDEVQGIRAAMAAGPESINDDPVLEQWLSEQGAAYGVTPAEADYLRSARTPSGRRTTQQFWVLLLTAMRATVDDQNLNQ